MTYTLHNADILSLLECMTLSLQLCNSYKVLVKKTHSYFVSFITHIDHILLTFMAVSL